MAVFITFATFRKYPESGIIKNGYQADNSEFEVVDAMNIIFEDCVVHHVDSFTADTLNPDTGLPYDNSWIVFSLKDENYRMRVGGEKGRAYVLNVGKYHLNWKMALGDFIDYHKTARHKIVLALRQDALDDALNSYKGHS